VEIFVEKVYRNREEPLQAPSAISPLEQLKDREKEMCYQMTEI
jgi:hypothetical protein